MICADNRDTWAYVYRPGIQFDSSSSKIAGAVYSCLPGCLYPRRANERGELSRTRDGRRRIVLPILPSSMTLGDDHREGANVLLPPALPVPRSPYLGPFALRRPLRSFSSSSSSFSFYRCSLPLPRRLLRLSPAGTLRSSYHNRRHPSCITCHFVPRRILSPRHDNRARNRRRTDDADDAERMDIARCYRGIFLSRDCALK